MINFHRVSQSLTYFIIINLFVRKFKPFPKPREDFSITRGKNFQRDTGQCEEMYPHPHEDSLSFEPG